MRWWGEALFCCRRRTLEEEGKKGARLVLWHTGGKSFQQLLQAALVHYWVLLAEKSSQRGFENSRLRGGPAAARVVQGS